MAAAKTAKKTTTRRRASKEAREQAEAKANVLSMVRKHVQLFAVPEGKTDDVPMLTLLRKIDSDVNAEDASSAQGNKHGRIPHPFNMELVTDFKHANVHHSACIDAKTAAAVGMGFKNEETIKKLEKLGLGSLVQCAIEQATEDFWTNGNGYLEVRRGTDGEIIAIHYLPARNTYVFIENDGYTKHYEVISQGTSVGNRHFACFGDLDDFEMRAKSGNSNFAIADNGKRPSEVIHFMKPSALSRHYGFPDWLAAVASIELVQCIKQQQFDFFNNRGVPEFLLFILGGKVGDRDWKKIENSIQSTIGPGNQGKSLAVNLWDENMKVQLEKLGMDGKTDGGAFSDQITTLSLDIVSAHRTPAFIAGIQVPGKMGAANEAINSILAFELLTVGPGRAKIEAVLNNTLGDPDTNGSLGLKTGDFKFTTLRDEMDLQPGGQGDTVARMRQSLPEAQAEGRDLEAGLKKAREDLTDEQIGEILSSLVLSLKAQHDAAQAA